jgi:hypothetical protein
MSNREEILITLRNGILDKSITEEMWQTANKMAKQFLEEKAIREEKAKKEHEQYLFEKSLPVNAIPRYERAKHVPQNYEEYLNYLATYDIEPLIQYADELARGMYKEDYQGKSTLPTLQFLREQIARRKNIAKNKYYQEAKAELEENKTGIKEVQQQLEDTRDALNEVKAKLTGDDPEKTKAYTT